MPHSMVQPPAPVRMLVALSEGILGIEKLLVGGLMALLITLIILNVVTRYAGAPLYWVDEAAVYSMVWLTFIGASALTRMRLDFAVTLLSDRMAIAGKRRLQIVVAVLMLLFGLFLLVICWNWMDPIGIASAGFNASEYAGKSFNFLYTEHTQTLNWPTWAVMLVLPIFAVTLTIHCAANLAEDLGLAREPARPGFRDIEGVN